MLIDTHTHLHDPQFEADRKAVITRALESRVDRMITIGTDLATSRQAVELAENEPALFATVGVHPHEVKHLTPQDYSEIEALARHPRVVGYGEVGLDFHYMHSPKDTQILHLRKQIQLARKLNLPLVIHNRESSSEILDILETEGAGEIGGVFHCFTADMETAQAAIAMGFYISFSGILTFPKARELQAVARDLPLHVLLVETDCPYLAPVPYRGKRNEPAHVRHTAEGLARIRGLPLSEIARSTSENARKIFKNIGV